MKYGQSWQETQNFWEKTNHGVVCICKRNIKFLTCTRQHLGSYPSSAHANLHNAYNKYIRWYSQKWCYNIAYVTNFDEKSHCPYISETERTLKEKDPPPPPTPPNKRPQVTWGQWKAHRHNTRVNTCAQGKCKKHAFKQAPLLCPDLNGGGNKPQLSGNWDTIWFPQSPSTVLY